MDLKKYHEITVDCWQMFKKYSDPGVNWDELTDDVVALDEKYKGLEQFKFYQKLIQVYVLEISRVLEEQRKKGAQNGNDQDK